MQRLFLLGLIGCASKSTPAVVESPAPQLVAPVGGDRATCTQVHWITGGNIVVDATWREIPVKVLLDTGATLGAVSKPFATKHGIRSVGTAQRMGFTGTVVETPMYDAGSLGIGDASLDASNLVSFETRTELYDFRIGTEQLLPHALELDVTARSFCIRSSPHSLATVPMHLGPPSNRAAMVTARFGDVEIDNMVLDTGAGESTLRADLVSKIAHEASRETDVVDAVGVVSKMKFVRIPARVCVDRWCTAEPEIGLTSGATSHIDGSHGLLGIELMVGAILVIDYPAQKFALRPLR